MLSRRRFIGVGAAAVAGGGLALAAPARVVRADSVEVRLTGIKQGNNNLCARACVVMSLKYFGFERTMTEPTVSAALPPNAHITTHVVPSVKTLTSGIAYGQWFKETDIDWYRRIYAEVSADFPLIALIGDGNKLGWNFQGHYIVVTGLTWTTKGAESVLDKVIFVDPWTGQRREMTSTSFKSAWASTSKGIVDYGFQGVTFWPA